MKQHRIPRLIGEEWLKALYSGEYKQESGELCNITAIGHTYCCLGVLGRVCGLDDATLSGISFVETPEEIDDSSYDRERRLTLYDKALALGFPKELLYSSIIPTIGDRCFARVLATMNDSGDYSFKEIAQWIRENVEFYDESEQTENQIDLEI